MKEIIVICIQVNSDKIPQMLKLENINKEKIRKEYRMSEKYASLSLGALKEIAKARGLKGISTLKKSELVERMVQADEADKKNTETSVEKTTE